MGEYRYDQFCYSRGEIDPKTQGRTDWEDFYKSAKQIRNCLVIPQGGVSRRWGTTYVDGVTIATIPSGVELSTLTINDSETYLMVWEARSLKIYLENTPIFTSAIPFTPYNQEDIPGLRFVQVENRIIIVNENFPPAQLKLTANAPNLITALNAGNTLTITTPLVAGNVYAVQFTGGALPTTSPQIYENRRYFIRAITNNTIAIYSDSTDASNDVNRYLITVLNGPSNVLVFNTWTLSNISFEFVPTFDFGFQDYSAITFTPSATSGTITLTASSPVFTPAMVGGLYDGNGGVMRITVFTDTTHVDGYTVEPFSATTAILGSLSTLAEPAWSVQTYALWPRTVGFFQNRLVFAGSYGIANGVWLSVINNAYNFDDSSVLSDDAISWYPATGGVNFIRSITSGRTLIVHSNTGSYSTPLATEQPVTPINFTLTEQSKLGVSPIQPFFIDNQILFADKSGNNIISMVWEITQNAFVTNNISLPSSNLIKNPVDMASFSQPDSTDGFYAIFVNKDGTVANYQTLIEQSIGAWSLMDSKTNIYNGVNADAYPEDSLFQHVITAGDKCWFTIERQIPVAYLTTLITGFTATTLHAAGHGISLDKGDLAFFIGGILPTTVPQIVTGQYYFVRGTDINNFSIYASLEDANDALHPFTISTFGAVSSVQDWKLTPKTYIEELTFDVFSDSTITYNLSPATNVLTGLDHLNGNVVTVKADDYVLDNQTVINGQITVEQNVSLAQVGLPFVSTFTPLPLNLPGQAGVLYKPKHIRNMYIRYFESIGMTIEGQEISTIQMNQIILGQPIVPQTATFEYTPMEGWNNVNADGDISIVQTLPLPMTILGISYVVEI